MVLNLLAGPVIGWHPLLLLAGQISIEGGHTLLGGDIEGLGCHGVRCVWMDRVNELIDLFVSSFLYPFSSEQFDQHWFWESMINLTTTPQITHEAALAMFGRGVPAGTAVIGRSRQSQGL
jgi:hypothetical protein